MSQRIRYGLAEPGSPAARWLGCTCPRQQRIDRADGSASYQRDEYCPVHRRDAAAEHPSDYRQARSQEDRRERERANR